MARHAAERGGVPDVAGVDLGMPLLQGVRTMVLVQFESDYHGFYRLGSASETLRGGWRPPRSLFYSTPLLPTSLLCDFCVGCAAVE